MNREGTYGRGRRDSRGPFVTHAVSLMRVMACLLAAAVVVLAGWSPAAAADGPDSIQGLTATYDVSASLRWKKGRLIVTSTALVTNGSNDSVGALTFNAAPARIGRMVLGAVTVGGEAASAMTDDQNIIVTLPTPLGPSQQASVTIAYTATFGSTSGNKQWLFAKVDGIATAYRWIPWLSRAYDFLTPTYGEPFVTRTSDEVRVSMTPDRPLKIATSGEYLGTDGLTSTFVARNVRDFNFAASPKYATRVVTWGGVRIVFYYVGLPVDKLQRWTLASLDRFSERVGPYPYTHLAVAEVPSGPSMESPALIWITRKAAARGTVKYLTVHEMAHQWFYGVVGNDQAIEPFADEAMAEFLTRDLIGHRGSNCAEDVLDGQVYDYSANCYYEVVYVQGDLYLNAYRQRVGDDAFWTGVRRYYDIYRFKLCGTRELFDILDEEAGPNGGGHSDRFPSLYP